MITGAQIGRQQRTPEKRKGNEDNEYCHAFLIIEAKRGPNGSSAWHVLCAESDEERDSWVEELVRYVTSTYNDEQTLVSSVAGPSPVSMSSAAQSAQPHSSTSSNPPTDLQTTPVRRRRRQQRNNAKLFNATAYPKMSASPAKSLAPSISERLEVEAPLSSSLPVSSPLVEEPEKSFAISQRANSELGHYSDLVDQRAAASRSPEQIKRNKMKTRGPNTPRVDAHGKVKISAPMNGTPIPVEYKFRAKEAPPPEQPPPLPTTNDRWEKTKLRTFKNWGFGRTHGELVSLIFHASNSRTLVSNDGERIDKAPTVAMPTFVPTAVFGVSLEEYLDVVQIAGLPAIVFRCIQYLEAKKAEQEEGIYRLSGSSAVIKSLKDRFNAEGDVDLLASNEYWDPHTIAGLLKTFLRELPASILTRDLRLRFLSVIDFVDPQDMRCMGRPGPVLSARPPSMDPEEADDTMCRVSSSPITYGRPLDDEEQIEKAQAVLNAFTKMEIGLKEYERARGLFTRCVLTCAWVLLLYDPALQFALSRLPRSKSAALYAAYTKFEKQHGTRSTLESTVLGKRRIQYEELTHDGRNYDVWFDYARLEEGALRDLREEGATREEEERATNRVSEVYERAVAQVPPGGEKRHWRRYIFLWLYYALFEEIETKDYERPRQIYETAIRVVPHKQFTFAKLWIMFARFEVRQLKLPAARKILGTAIGMCPKEALFKGYIQLEFDFDRVRTLYEKYIEAAWIKYAELESQLEDYARVRAIYELGVSQTALSMPELLWKAYIDFETKEGEREKARALYERLVQTSGHVKVEEEEEEEVPMVEGDPVRARQVFERGYKDLKSKGSKQERIVLLEIWKAFEEKYGAAEDVVKVQGMMPITSKRRIVDKETGQTVKVPSHSSSSNSDADGLAKGSIAKHLRKNRQVAATSWGFISFFSHFKLPSHASRFGPGDETLRGTPIHKEPQLSGGTGLIARGWMVDVGVPVL
ncbi:hypothetical protein C8Q78DRAFT_1083701 [Trametes maxima]|nr:hypothetical protein C8Q78DRAFT_1083701 [Trametes maxima]